MPYYTTLDILTFLSRAYHGYRESHNGQLPNTIWVSRGLYNSYRDSLVSNQRFTSADVPVIECLKYKSASVRPVEVIYTCVLKTTRCTGRYNG